MLCRNSAFYITHLVLDRQTEMFLCLSGNTQMMMNVICDAKKLCKNLEGWGKKSGRTQSFAKSSIVLGKFEQHI